MVPVFLPVQVWFTCQPKMSAEFNAPLGDLPFLCFLHFLKICSVPGAFSTAPLPCMPPASKAAQIFLTTASGTRVMRASNRQTHMPDPLQIQLLKETFYMAWTTLASL